MAIPYSNFNKVMKLIVADNKFDSNFKLLKSHSYAKAKPLSEAVLLEELAHVRKAFNKVKAGKIKSRPVSELLNDL